MKHSAGYAIEAVALQKIFTTKTDFWRRKSKTVVAVEEVGFCVERGELFGLLGPNGAGKTTTVKMLSTLLLPTAGHASILGLDLIQQTQAVRQRIGFTFGGSRGLYGRLTARDNLKYFAELYRIDPLISARRIPEMLELVGLEGREDDRVETFSSGMQQRLHLARVLLHDPELIFLDEPTVGIDPVGARDLRQVVKRLIGLGKTILLTTHYMAEAEELCDRIAIIKQGRIVALDTPASLKQRIPGDTLIEAQASSEQTQAILERLLAILSRDSIQVRGASSAQVISITTRQPSQVLELLAPFINQKAVQNLEVRSQTLEDVYVTIIQGEAE